MLIHFTNKKPKIRKITGRLPEWAKIWFTVESRRGTHHSPGPDYALVAGKPLMGEHVCRNKNFKSLVVDTFPPLIGEFQTFPM